MEDHGGDCGAAITRVAEAMQIASVVGHPPDLTIVFMSTPSFDGPCGEDVDGCAGLDYVMVDSRGSSLTHELFHHIVGPGHDRWLENGLYGLDSFASTQATGSLALSVEIDWCSWPTPTQAQIDALQAAELPVGDWLRRVQDMKAAQGCWRP